MKRRCSKCKKIRLETSFFKRKNGKRYQCKFCEAYVRKSWFKNRGGREMIARAMREVSREHPWRFRARNLNKRAGFDFVCWNDLKLIWNKSNGKCFYCGIELSEESQSILKRDNQVHIDHVIPNVHKIENLVLCCFKCNRRKQDNTIETFKNFINKILCHTQSNLERVQDLGK